MAKSKKLSRGRGVTEEGLRREVRSRVDAFGSLRKAAEGFGVAPSHLSKYLRGEINAGPAILRIAGVCREVRYYQEPRGKVGSAA